MLQPVASDWEGQGRKGLHRLEQHKYESPTLTRAVLIPGQCAIHDLLSHPVNLLALCFNPCECWGSFPPGVLGMGTQDSWVL